MAEGNMRAPRVRISYDELKAFLYLPVPELEKYTVQMLQDALQEKGIVHGIKEDVLEQMANLGIYNKEMLVAEGMDATESSDGYFEYHFNMNLDGKPTILPDGSVDYWSIHRVEVAKEGQVIATYHPAVMGTDGMTVKGKPILARRAREYPPIKGKGFTRSEDNLTYTADFEGKIEMKNDRIIISQVYEIFGNADLSVGNIDFNGDVVIHGNVCAGVKIRAGGSVTVDGIVEAAIICAGKDIILRGGMMGDSRSLVSTKGNITAKFFEYTTLDAQGNIQAQVFLNCDVTCQGQIFLSGKKAGIIGGRVYAAQGIEAANLGNDVEIHTEVRVGHDLVIMRQINELQKKVLETRLRLEKIEKGLQEFEKLIEAQAVKSDDPRKVKLLRVKIQDSAILSSLQAELSELEYRVEEAKDATVRVTQSVYPGVTIIIDEAYLHIKKKEEHVEYRKERGEVTKMFAF